MPFLKIEETAQTQTNSTFVLVGNGPSLRDVDFELLRDFNTIGLNRISKIYKWTGWRPDYFVCTTINVKHEDWRSDIQESIDLGIPTLLGLDLIHYVNDAAHVKMYPVRTFGGESVGEEDDSALWSDDLVQGVSKFGTSIIVAAQWAAYMGAQRLGFIGCDLGFHRSLIQRVFYRFGFIKIGNLFDRSHFDRSYGTPGGHGEFFNQNMTRAHHVIRRQCNRKAIEVFNCTDGGTLDVYERLPLASLQARKSPKKHT